MIANSHCVCVATVLNFSFNNAVRILRVFFFVFLIFVDSVWNVYYRNEQSDQMTSYAFLLFFWQARRKKKTKSTGHFHYDRRNCKNALKISDGAMVLYATVWWHKMCNRPKAETLIEWINILSGPKDFAIFEQSLGFFFCACFPELARYLHICLAKSIVSWFTEHIEFSNRLEFSIFKISRISIKINSLLRKWINHSWDRVFVHWTHQFSLNESIVRDCHWTFVESETIDSREQF